MEISASLFDIEEVAPTSEERVRMLREEIVRRYKEKIEERPEPSQKDAREERTEQPR